VSRNQIIERERRWQLPAALAAFGAAIFGFAAGVIQIQAYNGADDDTGLLLARHADSGSFAASAILEVASWVLLALPFAYLFLAAAARSERVNRALLGLLVIAPVLLVAGSLIVWQSYADVADQFVEEKPALEAEAEAAEEESDERGAAAGADEPGQEQRADEEGDAEEEEDPVEARADELTDDSSSLSTGFSISFGGLLGLAVGILYTCLQAMRAGLLTRFFGSLGMALAVALVLLQLLPGVLLYTVALGLLILGRWPGGRPPAWDAGRAIPWPRPGERPEDSGTVEGRGAEVEPREGSEEPQPRPSSPSGPRRKRKRRR
jgi:hypothetical protein